MDDHLRKSKSVGNFTEILSNSRKSSQVDQPIIVNIGNRLAADVFTIICPKFLSYFIDKMESAMVLNGDDIKNKNKRRSRKVLKENHHLSPSPVEQRPSSQANDSSVFHAEDSNYSDLWFQENLPKQKYPSPSVNKPAVYNNRQPVEPLKAKNVDSDKIDFDKIIRNVHKLNQIVNKNRRYRRYKAAEKCP